MAIKFTWLLIELSCCTIMKCWKRNEDLNLIMIWKSVDTIIFGCSIVSINLCFHLIDKNYNWVAIDCIAIAPLLQSIVYSAVAKTP